MARLSNFLGLSDPDESVPVTCRIVARAEIEKGLRLILGTNGSMASDETVLDFLSYAVHRQIDTGAMWIALVEQRVVFAILPIASPGRTVLLMSPGQVSRQTPRNAVLNLAAEICSHYADLDYVLTQVLLDPHDTSMRRLYVESGFSEMAELVYLSKTLMHVPPPPQVQSEMTLLTYDQSDAEIHRLFAHAIERSYERSLDCPGLTGVRQVTDVMKGHEAAGEFDPGMWHLLLEHGKPLGVLLLTPSSAQVGAVELVYLGLVPEARGRGLGDLLMRTAMTAVSARDFTELTLAVDSRNAPALGLYFRHGMKRVASRSALVRELCPKTAIGAYQS